MRNCAKRNRMDAQSLRRVHRWWSSVLTKLWLLSLNTNRRWDRP